MAGTLDLQVLAIGFGAISLASILNAGGLAGAQDWTGYAMVALPSLALGCCWRERRA